VTTRRPVQRKSWFRSATNPLDAIAPSICTRRSGPDSARLVYWTDAKSSATCFIGEPHFPKDIFFEQGQAQAVLTLRLPQILTSWDRLQRLMRETVRARHYHLGHSFERLEQDGSGVVAYFSGGQRECADLLVGADGIRSSVRGQLAPAVPGWASWKTLVSVTAYHSFAGEVEALNTPTIRRLTPSCRHQLPPIARGRTDPKARPQQSTHQVQW